MVSHDAVDVLLVGGGVASVRCARTLRREGFDGSILIVGDEPAAPYNRPPLTKEFLRDERRRGPARSRARILVRATPDRAADRHARGRARPGRRASRRWRTDRRSRSSAACWRPAPSRSSRRSRAWSPDSWCGRSSTRTGSALRRRQHRARGWSWWEAASSGWRLRPRWPLSVSGRCCPSRPMPCGPAALGANVAAWALGRLEDVGVEVRLSSRVTRLEAELGLDRRRAARRSLLGDRCRRQAPHRPRARRRHRRRRRHPDRCRASVQPPGRVGCRRRGQGRWAALRALARGP